MNYILDQCHYIYVFISISSSHSLSISFIHLPLCLPLSLSIISCIALGILLLSSLSYGHTILVYTSNLSNTGCSCSCSLIDFFILSLFVSQLYSLKLCFTYLYRAFILCLYCNVSTAYNIGFVQYFFILPRHISTFN